MILGGMVCKAILSTIMSLKFSISLKKYKMFLRIWKAILKY